jgi:hypothetical protein
MSNGLVEKVIKLMGVIKEIQVGRLTSGKGNNCDESNGLVEKVIKLMGVIQEIQVGRVMLTGLPKSYPP